MPPSPPSSTAREEGFALVAAGPLAGRVRVPGDKSISHRALMLAALAEGESRIEGLLEGEDVFATATALHAMGAGFTQDKDGAWRVRGVGARGLRQPVEPLEMGNSGTSTRLLMGLLASRPINASFVGDASLSRRPMARVMEPLARIGARFEAAEGGRLPISMRGARPAAPIEYRLPVASAQVKSAVLLAGLNIAGTTRVIEPALTRDHSERMLAAFGAELAITKAEGGRMIAISGPATLHAQDVIVPGDPSSAAFLAVAALLVPGSAIVIENVGINPTRAGLFELLEGMGADLRLTGHRTVGGEPVADLAVRASRLHGIDVPPEIAPSMIDEFPILFVAAALAGGRTVTSGLEELRVKESDRLSAMAEGLRAIGARIEERADGLVIEGAGGAPLPGGATIAARLDHRVAMSFAVAGLAARRPVRIDDMAPVATSFPGFVDLMTGLGARALTPARMIIAVDGPAASGKGTIARALARHFGLPHLDTGLLYRAVGLGVLSAGGDPANAADALAACLDAALPSDADLRSEAAGRAASLVSVHPAVRAALLTRQRAFARQPGGAVLDGRDIGTVIAPDADAKLFVTAAPEIRARRRLAELAIPGAGYDDVLADILARDARDTARGAAPLRQADDALLLDTSALDIDGAISQAIALVEPGPGGRRGRLA